MFKNLTIISVITAIIFLVLWIFNGFLETADLSKAISYIFIALLCGKLYSMDKEIKSIKTHLEIKGSASINKSSSNDIMKHNPDNNEY